MRRFSLLDSDSTRARWTSCKPSLEPSEILELGEDRAAALAAVERLPPEDRAAILSCYGFPDVPTIPELASLIHRSPKTIYYRRDRAIRRIRGDLNRGGKTR
jgi:DNA-directed RNA polymerase specialized sigma24 family protein